MTDPAALEAERIVREKGAHEFYRTYLWQQCAAQAREAQHNECQRCKARGLYAPCEAVHHIRPLLSAPQLALEQSNLMCLCAECHNEIHGRAAKEPLTPERW